MLEKFTSLEEKIISYLALTPDKNIQQIQRGLEIEDRNYPSVYNAVLRLKKKEYVKAKKGKSEKNVEINFFKLTPLGIGATLAFGDETTLLEVFDNYEKDLSSFKVYKEFIKLLKPLTAKKLLRLVGKTILQYGENAWLPETIAIAASCGLLNFTKEEMREIKRASMKVESMKLAIQESATKLYKFAYPEEGVEP